MSEEAKGMDRKLWEPGGRSREHKCNSDQGHCVLNFLEVELKRNKGQKKSRVSLGPIIYLLIFQYVDNTHLFLHGKITGVGLVRDNCDLLKTDSIFFTSRVAKRVLFSHLESS